MKFFTPECQARQYSIEDDVFEEFRSVSNEYRHHLDRLRGTLPDRVLELAEPSGMEDGLVVRVAHDRERRKLILTLRVGHLQMGYSDLVLTYEDAELSPEHDLALARIARSTIKSNFHGCDLAYHELDVTEDGGIEHRLIFHALDWFHPDAGGSIWFAVRCRGLTWHRDPKPGRRLPPSVDRYPNGPPTRRFGAIP